MEHLTCLSTEGLAMFAKTPGMEVIAATPEMVVLKGAELFTWVFDFSANAYCLFNGAI